MTSLEHIKTLFDRIPKRPETVCVGCDSTLTEIHHLIPQAKGGTLGPTVWLCSTCHDIVHAQARVLLSNNPETRKKSYYPNEEIRQRLEPLVEIAALAAKTFEENRHLYENVALQALTVAVSPAQLNRLHQLKALKGYSSMEEFLKGLIAHITGIKSTPKENGKG